MKSFSLRLSEKNEKAVMNCFLHSGSKKRAAVVVCPGGAYQTLADYEGDVVAKKYYKEGFNAFTVKYSVGELATFPNPLSDLSVAVKTIRENAELWGVDDKKIAVLGFSAGGHLALSLGTLWNNPEVQAAADCKNEENKPNAIISCYGVTGARFWLYHKVIFDVLTKGKSEEEGKVLLHNPKNVGPHTPPVFMWHTFNDTAVPVDEAIELMSALSKNDIPFESHIYPNGRHGLGLANEDKDLKAWHKLSVNWLNRLFYGKEKKTEQRAKTQIFDEI